MDTADVVLDHSIIAQIPVLVKARPMDTSGRRILEVQCSSEHVDLDGDIILQDALLKSAESFVSYGHLDIDHLSEFGYRLGIPDPSSYIVGKPLSVKAGPDRSTFVEGEISKSLDGVLDPVRNRYDEFWQSLQRDPPVVWYSSIYGWPTDMENVAKSRVKHASGATRLLIKALNWRSLAFTRSPKNTSLTSAARIITAKSYMVELAKSLNHAPGVLESPAFATMTEVYKAGECPACLVHKAPSVLGLRQHFTLCKGCPEGMADVFAHAIMHRVNMRRALIAR